jgi:hypothetical protein
MIPDRPKAWEISLGPAQIGQAQVAQTGGLPKWTGISPNTDRMDDAADGLYGPLMISETVVCFRR